MFIGVCLLSLAVLSGCAEEPSVSASVSSNIVEPIAEENRENNEEALAKEEVKDDKDHLFFGQSFGNALMVKADGTVSDFSDMLPGDTLLGLSGKYVYYISYETDSYNVNRKNVESGEVQTLSFDTYVSEVDYFDGKIYIYRTTRDSERLIEVVNEDTFEIEDTDYSLAKLDAFYPVIVKDFDTGFTKSYHRLMSDYGYIIVAGTIDGVYSYGKFDGEAISLIDGFGPDADSINYYDKDCIIYNVYSYSDSEEGIYLYRYDDKSNTLIAGGNATYIREDDGLIYYYTADDSKYNETIYSVHEYDLASGTDSVVITEQKKPGIPAYLPGVAGFGKTGNTFYFLADDGVSVGWYKSVDGKKERLDVPEVEHAIATEYGTIKAESNSEYCEFCNNPLKQYYCEYIELNDSFGEVGKKISEDLHSTAIEDVAGAEGASAWDAESASDCEIMGHGNYAIDQSDTTITSVDIIGDKYLEVVENGYWYGGGAHGMPYGSTYLFDLETGDRLTFFDIYNGNIEDFCDIIATKAAEDFESYGEEGSPYFAASKEEVYDAAYDIINDYITVGAEPYIILDHEGISYMFAPYEMGPYAAGFIEIRVSYEELSLQDILF